MKRADMVRTGAAQLMLAEEALERALVETSSLGVLLGQLRLQSGISMVVGQDAFDEIASTISQQRGGLWCAPMSVLTKSKLRSAVEPSRGAPWTSRRMLLPSSKSSMPHDRSSEIAPRSGGILLLDV